MQPRETRRASRSRSGIFCTALTLYATWPSAHAQAPPLLWLSVTRELASSPDLPHRRDEPLPLQLAFAIGSSTDLAKIDQTLSGIMIGPEPVPAFYAVRVNGQ